MSNKTERSVVAVLKTTPGTVVDDYKKVMDLADYQKFISKNIDTVINNYDFENNFCFWDSNSLCEMILFSSKFASLTNSSATEAGAV